MTGISLDREGNKLIGMDRNLGDIGWSMHEEVTWIEMDKRGSTDWNRQE